MQDFAKASQLGLWSGPGGAKASQLWSCGKFFLESVVCCREIIVRLAYAVGNSQLWSGLRPYSVFNNESCESLNSGTARFAFVIIIIFSLLFNCSMNEFINTLILKTFFFLNHRRKKTIDFIYYDMFSLARRV